MDKIKQKYLKFAKHCNGSDKFKHYFVIKNGKSADVLENGKLSCAEWTEN